jgi:D-xylose transport system substrate-binding protein
MKKQFLLVMAAVLGMLVLFAGCPGSSAGIKIGLSFSDFATERWSVEDKLMRELGTKAGATVVTQVANNDAKLQNDQIDNLVTQGVNVIIIVAEDGATCASAVDKAAAAGVPCIAYDRLIKTSKIACYISFDNVEVGRQQAKGVIAKVNKGRFALLGGSPTDNNAILFRNGQMEVLKPLIDKGDIKIVADQWVENWDMGNALKIMENILTSTKNGVDAVVASNDGTALGALQAMKAQKLAGKVPISGQDATFAGCNSIVKGELTVTILKDTRNLTPLAIDIAMKLAKKEKVDGLKDFTLTELTLDKSLQGSVPCKFLEVQQVTKENVFDLVVKSGFQAYDDVYKDIPAADKPAKP